MNCRTHMHTANEDSELRQLPGNKQHACLSKCAQADHDPEAREPSASGQRDSWRARSPAGTVREVWVALDCLQGCCECSRGIPPTHKATCARSGCFRTSTMVHRIWPLPVDLQQLSTVLGAL